MAAPPQGTACPGGRRPEWHGGASSCGAVRAPGRDRSPRTDHARDRRPRGRAAAGLQRRQQQPHQHHHLPAYSLLAKGFGEGFNGPLQVVVRLPPRDDAAPRANCRARSPRQRRGLGHPAAPEPDRGSGDVLGISQLLATGYATTMLVRDLREQVIPPVAARTGVARLRRRRDGRWRSTSQPCSPKSCRCSSAWSCCSPHCC